MIRGLNEIKQRENIMLEEILSEMTEKEQDDFVVSVINQEDSASRTETLEHLEMLYSPALWNKLFSEKLAAKAGVFTKKVYSDDEFMNSLSAILG